MRCFFVYPLCVRACVCVSTFTKLSLIGAAALQHQKTSPETRARCGRDSDLLSDSAWQNSFESIAHTQKCSQAPPKICLYLALIHDCSSCMETALKCLPNQTGWTQLQWSVWRGRINKVMTAGAFWERMDRKSEQTCGHSSRCLDGLPVNWKLLHFSPNCSFLSLIEPTHIWSFCVTCCSWHFLISSSHCFSLSVLTQSQRGQRWETKPLCTHYTFELCSAWVNTNKISLPLIFSLTEPQTMAHKTRRTQ